MPSNYPMYIPEDMKPLWRAQARKDGFITLAAWIRWLANNRCMDTKGLTHEPKPESES